jgi:TatD DNase family protein
VSETVPPADSLDARLADFSATLGALRHPQQRLGKLVDLARVRPPMPEALRRDEHLVPGCQVRLWFVREFHDGRCRFQTDSDAVTLKALTGLFCDLANDLPPEEVARFSADVLEDLGILKQLAESRRATVLRVAESMREFARAQMPDAGCPIPETGSSPQETHRASGIRHSGSVPCFDSHNHLQDERFAGRQDELVAACRAIGVQRMVVNGACEEDWPGVAELAKRFPGFVVPSFGCHPWYLHERTARWKEALVEFLDRTPGAAVGEIGIDRWIIDQPPHLRRRYGAALAENEPAPLAEQEDAFVWQLRLAAERDLPVSLHCLQAWGRLEELLRTHPRPARGFLLHSYGGPAEMVPVFARLGAYFSFPGYFLHERKARQRDAFRHVPPDRLLVETDAPDQPLPAPAFTLAAPDGSSLNHPANLSAVQDGLAKLLDQPADTLALQLAENFARLFGGTQPRHPFGE